MKVLLEGVLGLGEVYGEEILLDYYLLLQYLISNKNKKKKKNIHFEGIWISKLV